MESEPVFLVTLYCGCDQECKEHFCMVSERESTAVGAGEMQKCDEDLLRSVRDWLRLRGKMPEH